MSRRTIFLVLAASATLIATQAYADRECFEDSCRQPEAAEPTASSLPPPAVDEAVASEASAAAPKLIPAKALPQMVATPEALPVREAPVKAALPKVRLPEVVAEPAPPAPRPPVQSFADQGDEPVRLAPRPVKLAPAAVRVTNAVPEDEARAEQPAAPPVTTYRARRAAPAVVASAGAIYAEDDVVRVYPNPRHDPAWKVCQLDQRESDQRRCGAYSYHPYGQNGYRPYGTYAVERGAQVYMVAPNAKIISIDGED